MRLLLIAFAVTLTSVARVCTAHWLLDPLIGERLPFATLFVAVVIAAWIGVCAPLSRPRSRALCWPTISSCSPVIRSTAYPART
jgi:fluoride ion exporter CrcB/FEX